MPDRHTSARNYLLAAAVCATTALAASPLRHYFDLANIVMLFLLAVFLVSLRLGKGPAVLAAFLSVALFDFFFVPPRLTFAVADVQYLLTFLIMLTVALITGQLTAGLRRQAETARAEEQRTRALYEMAKALSGTLNVAQVVEISSEFLRNVAKVDAMLLLPDMDGELKPHGVAHLSYEPHLTAAAFDGSPRLADADGASYFTLPGATRMRGVLVAAPTEEGATLHENQPLLEAVASLVAIAVERLHYVEVAQQAQLQMASERLRSSVLSALSHDLRTPLTVLVGLADGLAMSRPPLADKQKEAAQAIREQSLRLAGLAENLLDMARLHAGEIQLRKEWQPLEEVVGASLKLLERSLAGHALSVRLPHELPLLEFDAVLIERVLCNLLENAAKYAPLGSAIELSACRDGAEVAISVRDHGPGIPSERQQRIFDMFVRGAPESPLPGVGLGLAICRAIAEAHGGTISAHNLEDGGACFSFRLPVGTPPEIEEDVALPEETP